MTDRDSGPSRDARDAPSASAAIAAGAALFDEERFLAARDVWEGKRRPPDDDESDDAERLLRGLAATAAATHRAGDGDRSGAAERADDAVVALASVSDPRGVALGPVREWAERLAAAPEDAGSAAAPRVRVDDGTSGFDGLSLAAAGLAATALAGADEPGDPTVFATATDLAREERGTGRTEFAELLFAYLRTPDARPQVAARLGDHVEREERKRRDVDGLF
ncbi:DUF309 domain-containing protein [Halorubrum sp. 2020YC2]|uniref:DUF309 domain-containing protein n=1 Tax=Halorubrum sp. 2020YC2 TaxID=2836432 RepID=UPI001BECC93F|nr:DUF309 domain-containing protein [Halorubrum sp. 2020YC2]QWC19220.1 DUF309 domain-containing protein [Halorubrum sp. 2020YC2]